MKKKAKIFRVRVSLNRPRVYLVLSAMVLPYALWISSTIHTNLTYVSSPHGPDLRVGGGEAA
jgi:hypothetical protein